MSLQFDVLVIGGGIVGLTTALAMAQQNHSVAIIDAGSFLVDINRADLRVYAINQASQTLLERLGVWQYLLESRVSPYQHMHVWDSLSGEHIDFDARDVAASYLGHIIEECILKQALLEQIALQPAITLFPDSKVTDVNNKVDSVVVHSEHQSWEGQLLMIADGANSPCRQKLQVPLNSWSYEQQALVATVAVEQSHQHTAYQVFNSDGPLAFLPLANMQHCSIVWSTEPQRAKALMALDDEAFNAELTQAFSGKLGQVKVISARHQFPLQMRHVKQYAGDRWLLLGDAAHTIHPLAGLGLNVGLADVVAWMHCLETGNGVLVSKRSLGAYQRERKYAVWQIIALMEGFKRLFSISFAPVVTARGLGLGLCNEFMPLKRLFIEHARGVTN